MPPVGIETTISAGERTQTYALDRAATGTGKYPPLLLLNIFNLFFEEKEKCWPFVTPCPLMPRADYLVSPT